jgi:hypothetical protein
MVVDFVAVVRVLARFGLDDFQIGARLLEVVAVAGELSGLVLSLPRWI